MLHLGAKDVAMIDAPNHRGGASRLSVYGVAEHLALSGTLYRMRRGIGQQHEHAHTHQHCDHSPEDGFQISGANVSVFP